MKKIYLAAGMLLIILTGCQVPTSVPNLSNGDDFLNLTGGDDYVDVMTEDPDGFIRFPGEPTRESKDYYIIEDICGQFTEKFMEGVTGKKFAKIENPFAEMGGIYVCHYYFEGNDSVLADLYLVLEYLNVENHKKALEFLDYKLETSDSIPMDHFMAINKDGDINGIYLVLGSDKFIRLDRSSTKSASNEEMKAYAVKIAQKIRNYK